MIEKATFAAGCFWGIESAFRAVPGVVSATSGYIGGHVDNPTYQQVCTGRTGHAEAVEVEFDPAKTSFALLLQKFFSIHDPTQVDRQGPDIGSQYRTAIFTHSPEQAEEAKAAKAQLDGSGIFRRPIATEIVPAGTFWRAEEYHQRYDEKHGRHCAI
jgi:peptide-methionine (S)-S-oxide reductase